MVLESNYPGKLNSLPDNKAWRTERCKPLGLALLTMPVEDCASIVVYYLPCWQRNCYLLCRSEFQLLGIKRWGGRLQWWESEYTRPLANSHDANKSSPESSMFIRCLFLLDFFFVFLHCRCGNSRDCFWKTGSCCRGSR